MNISLEGKRAVVCGSTQGIGRACAEVLASLGAEIVLVARNADALRAVAAELPADHDQSHTSIVADFAKPDALRDEITAYAAEGKPTHVLVNNTGGPPAGPLTDAPTEALLAGFRAHVLCNQILTQALVPSMKAEQFGRIINIISTSVKAPIPGLGVSNTIRGAVASWAKTLAGELGPFGITVNNVLPGFTDTKRLEELLRRGADKAGVPYEEFVNQKRAEIPARRLAEPAEIAYAVGFLASPAAAYINGINLPVDGGRLPTL